MKLTWKQKVFLTVVEGFSVFFTIFLSQMISTVFPAYSSVKIEFINNSQPLKNCSTDNPSNVYVSILIGSKYGTELIMFPIVGWFADNYYPPLILFYGAIIEAMACIIYSISENFYSSILGRIIDAIGYSIVSTSGLTIIYTLYFKETSRNKIITIDSILVYVAYSVSPLVAGSIFESMYTTNRNSARIFTFLWLCPIFLTIAFAISPFAFIGSSFSRIFGISGHIKNKDKFENSQNGVVANNLLLTKNKLEKHSEYKFHPEINCNELQGINRKSSISILNNDHEIGVIKNDIPPEFIDHHSMCSHKSFPINTIENKDERESLKVCSNLSLSNSIIVVNIVGDVGISEERKQLTTKILLKDPHILIVFIALIFNSLIGNSLETTLPIFMIRKFCSDQTQQGLVWLFGFFSLKGFFLSGVLFHLRPQICWCLPMIGLVINGAMVVCLNFSYPWWVIGVCMGIMCLFSAITEVTLIPVIPKIIDTKYQKTYGSASGLTLIAFTISGIIGTFPVGPFVEYCGFLALCSILCVFTCLIAPWMLCLKRYFK